MLLTLLLVPASIGLYFRHLRRRERTAVDLGPLGLVQTTSGRKLGRRRHLPLAFFLFSLSLLLVGLARPETVISLPKIEGTVILSFDVSNSMTADDLEPTRLDAAKTAALAFVESQPSTIDIGIVAFSNGGLVIQQPTNDQAAILSAIERLSTQGGTSLGHGIFTSLNAIAGEPIAIDLEAIGDDEIEEFPLEEGAPLQEGEPQDDSQPFELEDYSSAVIVLLTDGENTGEPDPLEIAQVAAEAGVRIYPIGVGSEDGAIIEVEGFNILTQLNERTLQEIASLTNGAYFYAEDEESLLEIYENIDLQLTIEGEKREITSLVAALAILFLLVGGAMSLLWFGRIP